MDASYNPRSSSLYGNPYYFTGREVDTFDNGNLKIMNYRHRYYDTYTGRWLTHDPLGVTPNPQQPNRFNAISQYKDGPCLYEYVRSNPTHFTDPLGLIIAIPGFKNCDPWENDGDTYLWKKTEYGCQNVSMGPMPPTIPIVDVVVEIVDVFLPPTVICNVPMSYFEPGYLCQCMWRYKRPCKRQCCRKYYSPTSLWKWKCVGTKGWTEKEKRFVKRLFTYGESYKTSWGAIRCGCDNPKDIKGQAYLNKFNYE